jgi:transcriptional regulator with AAA-type ATPase domain/tetratricopeptide (TPR) repeat protein
MVMDELGELLGESRAIDMVRDKLRRLLERQRAGQRLPPVLIQGDTGTGKGLVARLLHRHGARSRGPFVDVNCAAIPETLLEAELFGFERGAFTDARRAKPGLFQAAHGGVLFLDEIALLPGSLQAKLLTAIEQRAVRRLGSTRPEPADVWLISATNADFRAAVRARRFREDLYHRLAVLTLDLPPLRARGRDVLLLAERFLARACAEYGLSPKRLDAEAQEWLLAYEWPGNIRELGNAIERAAVFTDTAVVTAENLGSLQAHDDRASPAPRTGTWTGRDEAMRQELLAALEEMGGNVSRAAARLGVARNTVYARVEKFGLRTDRPHKAAPGAQGPAACATGSPASEGGLRWERRSLALLRVDLGKTDSIDRPVEPATGLPAPDTRLQWEQRSLILLRADLRNTDRLDAWSQASRALDAVIAKVHSFGGRVDELTPTGLVAAFGLEPAEDAPRRAAHAAMAIHNVAARARDGGEEVPEVTISLHVAQLLIGRLGPRIEIDAGAKRAHWPVLDHLSQARAPGETVVSAAAAPFLERRFELARLGTMDGQGSVYRLTGTERRGFGLWGAMTRFVGRREELEVLRSRLATARSGHGQVVAIVGEAGVGKSRLIYELAPAQRLQGWRVLEGPAVSYGQETSYLPVIDLLRGYFKIQDDHDHREIREKITGKLLTLDDAFKSMLPAFLALLDVPVDDVGWHALDPKQRRQRTLDAVKRLLLREAQEQPLLLVFEDLHWIDSETQALLDGLVEALGSARLLLLVSYRPEYQHPWGGRTGYSQLRLDTLPPARAQELLDALLGEDPGLVSLKQLLVKRGNPFFLEETVRTLVETNALAGERGEYRLTQPVPVLQIPPTVQAVLAARIDRLAPEDRRLLQTASVVGKDVPVALLQAIAEADELAMRAGLARLQAAEFLYEVPLSREAEYTFKHALTHDVAYGELLTERRRELHARIVEAIERLYEGRLAEHIERLAHHAFRGELWERAVRYFRQSGDKAFARSALREALALFEQALSALDRLPEERTTLEHAFDLRLEIRNVLVQLGDYPRIRERLQEAAAIAEQFDDDHRRGRVSTLLVNFHDLVGEMDEAVAAGTRALAIANRCSDLGLRLQATKHAAQVCHALGEYERVVDMARANLAALPPEAVDERFGESAPVSAYARVTLVLSLAQLGRFAEAAEPAAVALQIAERTGHAFTIGFAHWAALNLHAQQGDWARALSHAERGLAALRAGHVDLNQGNQIVASAWILAHLGQTADAATRIQEGEQYVARWGAGSPRAARTLGDRVALGRACLLLERAEDARRLVEEVFEAAHHFRGSRAHALHLFGELAAHPRHFDPGPCARYYGEALALAEELKMRPLVAHCHLGLGKLYRSTGEREQAREHLGAATRMYREMDMRFWLEQAEGCGTGQV